MANPDSVPAGKYGKAALESLGVWTRVEKQVARAENVRAALVLVSRGEAPLGIVYATDALADRGVRIVDTFPAASHPPIVYPAALTHDGQVAAAQRRSSTTCNRPRRGRCGNGTASRSLARRMFELTPDEVQILALSLRVAAVSVVASLPIAILIALLLARVDFPGKTLVDALVHLPLVLPPVVVGFGLLILLGKRGPIGSVLDQCCGIVFAFRWTGAAVASALMGFPLMVRAIRLSIEAIDRRYEVAARTLGGSPLWVFASITLPLALPGIITGTLLVVRARTRRVRRHDHLRVQHSGRDADAAARDLHVHAGAGRRRTGDPPVDHRRRAVDRGARRVGVAHAPRFPSAPR